MGAIDRLFDAVTFRCVCCGAPNRGGREATCECHSGAVDRCGQTGRCAEHCRCAGCTENREHGLERVNWTGTKHFALVGSDTTLCGRKIGGPPVWRRPMLYPNGREECRHCTRAIEPD